jgi:hypothetical protein
VRTRWWGLCGCPFAQRVCRSSQVKSSHGVRGGEIDEDLRHAILRSLDRRIVRGVSHALEDLRAREGGGGGAVGAVAAASREVADKAHGLDADVDVGGRAREEIESDLEGALRVQLLGERRGALERLVQREVGESAQGVEPDLREVRCDEMRRRCDETRCDAMRCR